jgi:drug/metabolite transporter (DMT)-like permease
MALAAMFFSLMTVFVKMIGTRMPSAEVVFFRSVISVALTLGMLRHHKISPWGNRKGLLLVRGISGFMALLCFFYAIARLPLADVTVIHFTHPVFVALLAALFLREHVSLRQAASLFISITGVLVITRPSFLTRSAVEMLPPLVVGVALAGAILASVAYVLVRKLRKSEDPLVVVLWFPLISVPAAVPIMWSNAVWPTPREWLLLAGVGITTQIAQVYLTRGLHAELAARATSVSYLQIVLATIWGMLLFGEIPDIWVAAGAMLVFVGILLVSTERKS